MCTYIHGLLWWLSGKESVCSAEDTGELGLIPSSGRSPEGGDGNLVQDSCLENPMDRGAWQITVHRVTQSQTWLSMHAHIYKHTHRKKKKEFNLNTKDSHRIIREQKNKKRKKTYKSTSKTMSKMARRTYILVITLNTNRVTTPTRRHRLAERIQK